MQNSKDSRARQTLTLKGPPEFETFRQARHNPLHSKPKTLAPLVNSGPNYIKMDLVQTLSKIFFFTIWIIAVTIVEMRLHLLGKARLYDADEHI